MESKKSTFYTILYQLSKSFENLTFSLKRTIDQQNIQILFSYQQNSYSISPDISERAHHQVLVNLNKARISQTILAYLQAIIHTPETSSSKTLETLYWLLNKYDVHQYLALFESAVRAHYGEEKLGEIKQMNQIPADLEKVFDLPYQESPDLKGFIAFIEGLYLVHGEIEIEKMDAEEDILDTTGKESEVEEEAKTSSSGGKVVLKPSGGELVNIEKLVDPNQDIYWFTCRYLTEGDPESHVKLIEGELPKNPSPSGEFEFAKGGSGKFKGDKREGIEDFLTYKKSVLKQKKEHFKDDDFRPEMETITPDYKTNSRLQEVRWHRIGETTKNKLMLCEEVSPSDIVQGRLGNCYFLSALSALAEKKNLIERLFVTRKASTTGIYSVWLCDSGEWKNVIVDDYFPCNTAGKKRPSPRFARCKNDDIWVLILEKAFAKLYGTYYAIGGGYLEEALSCLTGAPIKYLRPKSKEKEETLEEIWKFLTKSTEKGFMVTAASRKESKSLNNKAMGLASGHGYAVLDAKQVTKADGKKERLVKMRNPWGTLEWKGEWSDNSENWTPELLSSVGYTPKNLDGVFWMNLQDFEKHFYNFCCCEVYDDFKYSWVRLGEGKRQRVFSCTLKVNGAGGMSYIGVQQKRKKYFEGNPAYLYSYVRVILMKIEEGGKKKFIHGKYKHAQTIVIREELEAGAEYLVFVEVDWMQSFYNEIVVTSYSQERIEIKEEVIAEKDVSGLYEEIVKGFMDKATQKGKVKETKIKGIKAENVVKLEYENKFGLIVNLLKNKEKDAEVFWSLQPKTPERMELLIPQGGEWPVVKEHLKKGEKKLIVIKLKKKHLKTQVVSLSCQENVVILENLSKEKMIEACKSKGKKLLPLKDDTVEMYTLKFEGGVLVYYVNKSDRTLQDKVSVDNKNVVINGEEKDFCEVLVKPGSEFLLEIRVKDLFGDTKFHKESKVNCLLAKDHDEEG